MASLSTTDRHLIDRDFIGGTYFPRTAKCLRQASPTEPEVVEKNEKDTDVPVQSADQGGSSDEEVDRGQWSNPVEFVLSCLGYAVGLGNVWRFPYLVYSNGGGAFLIPYVIMLIFVGLPLFFIELIVGQYSSAGPMDIWPISPIFKGVGAGMLIISAISSIYYNMILAWSLYYMFASWQSQVPWYDCKNSWNTPYCYTKREAEECETRSGSIWFNLTCFNSTDIATYYVDAGNNCTNISMATTVATAADCVNLTKNVVIDSVNKRNSASEEYYIRRVLDLSPSIDETGEMKWELVLVLLLAWIICCVCVIKGIKSSGKVVYFTATFPYIVLLILLIRGAMLDGAIDGILYYIVPKWEKLGTAKVWVDAAGQVFFSLSVGMGGLMTYASYNPFHSNVYRDTLIVVIADGFTSVFAGFAIFSTIGYLAKSLGKTVDKVITSGSGLAFVVFPEVVTYLEPPQLWASLFFLMLITLAIDSQFATVETCLTTVVDALPVLRRWKPIVAAVICAIMFLLGLTMCTQSGLYWVELMSYYSSGWSLVLIALAEAIVFPWVYGASRLIDDLQKMVGFRLYWHWWFCWKFISPVLLIGILIFNVIDFTPLAIDDYVLPDWSQAIGWLMATVSVVVIPLFAIVVTWKSFSKPEYDGLGFGKRLLKLTQPTADWKPAHERRVCRPRTSIEVEMDAQTIGSGTEKYGVGVEAKQKTQHTNYDDSAFPALASTAYFVIPNGTNGTVNPQFQYDDEIVTHL